MKNQRIPRLAYGFTSLLLLLSASFAAQAETRYEYAPVVQSTPIYQLVEVQTPLEQCWEEEIAVERYRDRPRSNTPVIVSTILGGALGNAVGNNKSSQRVGTVVGAVLGHSIGRDIVRNNSRSSVRDYEIVERCETIYETAEEERLVGYQVTYLFEGEERTLRAERDPGEQIRIRISVDPVL